MENIDKKQVEIELTGRSISFCDNSNPVKKSWWKSWFVLPGIVVALLFLAGAFDICVGPAFNFISMISAILFLLCGGFLHALQTWIVMTWGDASSIAIVLIAEAALFFCWAQMPFVVGVRALSVEEYGIELRSLLRTWFIPWCELEALSCDTRKSDQSRDWTLKISSRGKAFCFSLANLSDSASRHELLSLLKLKVGKQRLSSDFNWDGGKDSYTKIWFESLHQNEQAIEGRCLNTGRKLANQTYEIEKKLTRGGQACLYLAVDSRSSKRCVIKEYVLPAQRDVAYRERSVRVLEQELEIFKQLNHPGIVQLNDFFMENQRAYMVFDYIEGENLRTIVQNRGPLPEPEVIRIAASLCEILDHLRQQNPVIVHRDFTPDNILMGTTGNITLIDFSVARHLNKEGTLEPAGKTNYAAVEQLRGQALCVTDIYAFGCTLFYLLTGEDPQPLTQSVPADRYHVSPTMRSLICSCTAQLPELRPSLAQIRSSLNSACLAKLA